jgi:DNA (cytosine-5)-methyltransferase 1
MICEQREVYLTDEKTMANLKDLIRVCFVAPREVIVDLSEWLNMSPDHFYITYKFAKLKVNSWEDRSLLPYEKLEVCTSCVQERLKERESFREFTAYSKEHPLSVLDLFGGVGAFSHGLAEGSGCLKLASTVEISPSAAKTTK